LNISLRIVETTQSNASRLPAEAAGWNGECENGISKYY